MESALLPGMNFSEKDEAKLKRFLMQEQVGVSWAVAGGRRR